MLFAECVSAKQLPDPRQPHDVAQSASQPNCCPIYVSHMMSLAEPNRCPIYVSRMMLFAECVSAKPLPDLRQPHDVVRRVRLSLTVVRSTSAA